MLERRPEDLVRNTLAFTVAVCLFSVSAIGWVTAQQAKQAPIAPTTLEDVLKAVRADLQGERADIMAKNLTLSSQAAAKFWPMYATYQKEQDVIMDDQLKGIQKYIESFDTLDDAGAASLITANFDRDARMNALRQKWFGEFQKTVGTKLAVRAMQVDRTLSLVHQIQFAARIPLAH